MKWRIMCAVAVVTSLVFAITLLVLENSVLKQKVELVEEQNMLLVCAAEEMWEFASVKLELANRALCLVVRVCRWLGLKPPMPLCVGCADGEWNHG